MKYSNANFRLFPRMVSKNYALFLTFPVLQTKEFLTSVKNQILSISLAVFFCVYTQTNSKMLTNMLNINSSPRNNSHKWKQQRATLFLLLNAHFNKLQERELCELFIGNLRIFAYLSRRFVQKEWWEHWEKCVCPGWESINPLDFFEWMSEEEPHREISSPGGRGGETDLLPPWKAGKGHKGRRWNTKGCKQWLFAIWVFPLDVQGNKVIFGWLTASPCWQKTPLQVPELIL